MNEKGVTIVLEYHVPQLGKVSAKLCPYGTRTYNLLDHYGHIDRLRRIDQLGVIRNVYEGAHHSRWEYVMLQLSLIYNPKRDEESKGLGLSSKTEFFGKEVSGTDILQMWTLLFNAGHLPGTFATERALLRYCKEHKELKNTISKGLPQKARNYFKGILEENSTYDFHKILVYFYLGRYRKYRSDVPNFIDFLYEVMNFYIFDLEDQEERQKNLRNIFRRVRQISYLFLDSHYGPVPVNFDLSTIFLNLPDYVPSLFKGYDSPIIRTLNSFENLLSTNVYHSAESIRELGIHGTKIELKLDNFKEKHRLTIPNLKDLLTKEEDLFRPIHTSWGDTLVIHGLLEIPPFTPFNDTFLNNLSYDKEAEWNNKYGESLCQLTFQSAPRLNQLAINLSFKLNSTIQTNVKIIAKFLRDMINLSETIKNDERIKQLDFRDFVIDRALQKTYQDLLISIIKYITQDDLYFEFKIDNIARVSIVPIRGSKNAVKKLEKICENIGNIMDREKVDPARSHELQTLKGALLKLEHRSELLLSLSRILIYDEKRDHLTELDGFGLGIKNGKLGVLLVEAKDTKRGSGSKSENDLRDKFEKLKFKTSKRPEIQQIGKGSYCYLAIDGKE